VLLTVAFVVAMVESVLAFRLPLVRRPASYKWVHLGWLVIALGCAIAGMAPMVISKMDGGYKHMYSVHAWTGAIVLVGFFLQLVVSDRQLGSGVDSGTASGTTPVHPPSPPPHTPISVVHLISPVRLSGGAGHAGLPQQEQARIHSQGGPLAQGVGQAVLLWWHRGVREWLG
jgi:hypothetical protein